MQVKRSLCGWAVGFVIACGLLSASRAGAEVYWDNTTNDAIGRASLDGTGANQSFVASAGYSYGVAVDGQHIYWANTSNGTIGRANLDGSGVDQSFITGAHVPISVAVDGQQIYWGNGSSNTIGRASLDGGSVNQSFITGADGLAGLALDGQHVYWGNAGTGAIGRANLDGSGVDQSFILGGSGVVPNGVAVDAQHIYWTDSSDSTIGRANLDGSGVDQSFILGASHPFGVAVDDQHIYWTNFGDGSGMAIGRANLDGTATDQQFVTGAKGPSGIAVSSGTPAGSRVTLSFPQRNCSVPCEMAFLATVTSASGQPEPNVSVRFAVDDAAGRDASSRVAYGIDGAPGTTVGRTDGKGRVLFDVAASTGTESYADLVAASDGSRSATADATIVPSVGAVPQVLTISAQLVATTGAAPAAPATASWSLHPTSVRTVLIRPSNPNVSIDNTAFPFQDVAVFVFDPYRNQYRFGLRAYIQSYSASGQGRVEWQTIGRFLQGNESESPFTPTQNCVVLTYAGPQCFESLPLCTGNQLCQLPDCTGDIVCQSELRVDGASQVSNLAAYATSSQSGEQLADIEQQGDPIQGPWGGLFTITPRRAGNTDDVDVLAAAIDAQGNAYGAFSPNGSQLMIDPVTNASAPVSEYNETHVVFSTGSSAAVGPPQKKDQLVQLSATGVAVAAACAGAFVAAPETLGLTDALAIALGCGSALTGAAGQVVGIADPPIGPYSRIATGRAMPTTRVTVRLCNVLRVNSGCARLLRSATGFRRASELTSSLEEAFALALNRYSAASHAHDFHAALAQQGAARALAALLDQAARAERAAGRRLASLLVNLHANPRISAATVKRIVTATRGKIAAGMRGLPAWLSRRLIAERLAGSSAQLRDLLLTALSHSSERGVTLAELLSQVPIPASFGRYAAGMSSANLTALVETLIADRALINKSHQARLLQDTLLLDSPAACSAKRRSALAERLTADAGKVARGSLRDLLTHAISPFLRYHRGQSAALPSCKLLAASKARIVRRTLPQAG